MPHISRLDLALQKLLQTRRVAALGSVNADATPLVSMVPYAIDPQAACLVIHISSLAAHTGNLRRAPTVSLMVVQQETTGEPVHALERVTVQGLAAFADIDSARWHSARAAYVARFPQARQMLELGDFRFVTIAPGQARHVAGFGAARSVGAQELGSLLSQPPDGSAAR